MKPATKTYRILLAEDDTDDQYLLKMGFKSINADVKISFASDGVSVLDMLENSSAHPDLIMLDINMPRMDGKEVLKHIKSNPSYSTIPVVMYTTSEKNEDIEESYRLGASSYIVKPLSFDEIIVILKALCHYWFNIVQRLN